MKHPNILKAGVAPLALSLALIGTPAFAQTQDVVDPTGADAQTEPGVDGEEIVVTGSLISNPNLERSAPVNATSAEEIELLQSNVAEEILREIPGVVPSIGSAVNNGNGGASYVNLRGLGSNRNIVLLDGTRIVPADLLGRVDLNNIPVALVERVDVLTGGASATYGADAITGVVNFVTRDDFAGLEIAAASQITEEGDGPTVRLDLTTGANFDDGRGNVVLGIGYQESDAVYQGARDVSVSQYDSFTGAIGGSGTTTPSRFSIPGQGTRQINAAGTDFTPGTAFVPFNFNPFNVFQTPFERYNIYAQGRYEVSDGLEVYTRGLFSKNQVSTIIAPSGAFSIAVQVPLSNPFLTTAIRNTFCANNDSNTAVTGIQTLTPAQCAAAALATSPTDPNYREITTTFSRRAVEVGPRVSDYTTTIFDYKAGLRGNITDSVTFDLFGAYGESENLQEIGGYTLNSRFRQGIRATNTTSCLDTSNGCVPINIFGPTGSISPEAVDFLNEVSTVRTRSTLGQARATIAGDFGFASPFAEDFLSFAVGAEFRDYSASQVSDTLAQGGDLGGAGGASPNIDGGFKVYEGFAEAVLPLIQDRPFFEDLTLTGGVRYSEYEVDAPGNPKFDTFTWTAGGSWTPGFGFKVRGNYSRAVRAPNINELFSPVNTTLTNLSDDPCATLTDNGTRIAGRNNPTGELLAVCLAQGAPAFTIGTIQVPTAGQGNSTGGGNLALEPETSDSYTVGAVWEPSFLPGFNISVDYYNIEIEGAITAPTPDDAITACFGSPNGANFTPAAGASTTAACTAIRRDPGTGQLSGDPATTPGLFLSLSNLGYLKTSGIDVLANYSTDALGFARLGFNFVFNWTDESIFEAVQGVSGERDCVGLYSSNCGSIQPEYQWSLRTTLGFDFADLSLLWRHIDAVSYEFADDPAADAFSGTLAGGVFAGDSVNFNEIEAYDYFDLTARFSVADNISFTLTAQNLFDKKPPLVGNTIGSTTYNSGNTYPSTYDALGRRYGAAIKLTF